METALLILMITAGVTIVGLLLWGWFLFCKNHPILGMLICLLTLGGE